MNKNKSKHKGFDTMKKSKHKQASVKGGKSHSAEHMSAIAKKRWNKNKSNE
jgi:hypothetical protein